MLFLPAVISANITQSTFGCIYARISKVEIPTKGIEYAIESPLANPSPIRNPVNEPGPIATAIPLNYLALTSAAIIMRLTYDASSTV